MHSDGTAIRMGAHVDERDGAVEQMVRLDRSAHRAGRSWICGQATLAIPVAGSSGERYIDFRLI